MKNRFYKIFIYVFLLFCLTGCSSLLENNGNTTTQSGQVIQVNPGKDGRSIVSISLTNSNGNVDTYTILYSDSTTSTFTVTNGKDGVNGEQGIQGIPGKDGHTPKIEIGLNGNWIIDGVDSEIKAQGADGKPGQDGLTPHIGKNGNWWIGDTDTGVKAECDGEHSGETGKNGLTPEFRVENGILQWKYTDEEEWKDLFEFSNSNDNEEVETVTVTFYVDDEVCHTSKVKKGSYLTDLPELELNPGDEFIGWGYYDIYEDEYLPWKFEFYPINKDLELFAYIREFDIDNIYLNSISVEYDGEKHYVECENLPSHLIIEYIGNGVSEVGTHRVFAIIYDEDYNELKVLSGTISIENQYNEPTLCEHPNYHTDILYYSNAIIYQYTCYDCYRKWYETEKYESKVNEETWESVVSNIKEIDNYSVKIIEEDGDYEQLILVGNTFKVSDNNEYETYGVYENGKYVEYSKDSNGIEKNINQFYNEEMKYYRLGLDLVGIFNEFEYDSNNGYYYTDKLVTGKLYTNYINNEYELFEVYNLKIRFKNGEIIDIEFDFNFVGDDYVMSMKVYDINNSVVEVPKYIVENAVVVDDYKLYVVGSHWNNWDPLTLTDEFKFVRDEDYEGFKFTYTVEVTQEMIDSWCGLLFVESLNWEDQYGMEDVNYQKSNYAFLSMIGDLNGDGYYDEWDLYEFQNHEYNRTSIQLKKAGTYVIEYYPNSYNEHYVNGVCYTGKIAINFYPSEPEEYYLTIGDIINLPNGYFKTSGTVIAINTVGFIISDNDEMYVYKGDGWECDLTVGDVIEIEGNTSIFGKGKQFNTDSSYQIVDHVDVENPVSPKILTFIDYENYLISDVIDIEYVQVTGKLSYSGKYYNFIIDEHSIMGSISYPFNGEEIQKMNDLEVVITGYVIYLSTSWDVNYLNILATDVSLVSDFKKESAPIETSIEELVNNKPTENLKQIYYVEGKWNGKNNLLPFENRFGKGTLTDDFENKIEINGLSSKADDCLYYFGRYYYTNSLDFTSLNILNGSTIRIGVVYDLNEDNYYAYFIEVLDVPSKDSEEEKADFNESNYANGFNSYVDATYEEKAEILSILENYAMKNHLTGIPITQYYAYNYFDESVVLGSEEYLNDYGFGVIADGYLTKPLAKETNTKWKNYYHDFTSKEFYDIYAVDANENYQILPLINSSYFGMKGNELKNGYEYINVLSNSLKPIPVNPIYVGNKAMSFTYKIEVKTGSDYRYYTNSNDYQFASFSGREIALEDYLTPFIMAAGINHNNTPITSYFNTITGLSTYNSITNFYGNIEDYLKIFNENVGIRVYEEDGKSWIEFDFYSKMDEDAALRTLLDVGFSPIPLEFINVLGEGTFYDGISRYGTFYNVYSPVDTTLSCGPYVLEEFNTDNYIAFTKNPYYFEEDRYNIEGVHIAYTNDSLSLFESGYLHRAEVPVDRLYEYITNNNLKEIPGTNYKLNLNTCTQEEWEQLFGVNGSVCQTEYYDYWECEPIMSNDDFVNGLFYSFDRLDYGGTYNYLPTVSWFNNQFMINPTTGLKYNDSIYHKEVINKYYENTNLGYNLEYAQELFRKASKEMIDAGYYSIGDTITIEIAWMSESNYTNHAKVEQYFENAFNSAETGLYLDVVFWFGTLWSDVYYKKMMVGQFDIGFGSVSGDINNPLNFIKVLSSDQILSETYTLNWGNSTNEVSEDIYYDGKYWSFDSLWYAANVGGYFENGLYKDSIIIDSETNADNYEEININYELINEDIDVEITDVKIYGYVNMNDTSVYSEESVSYTVENNTIFISLTYKQYEMYLNNNFVGIDVYYNISSGLFSNSSFKSVQVFINLSDKGYVELNCEDALVENDYGTSTLKPAYVMSDINDTVLVNGYFWMLKNSIICSSNRDRFYGSFGIRARAADTVEGTARVEIKEDIECNIVEFDAAVYGSDATGIQVRVEYSTDSGNTWFESETFTINDYILESFMVTLPQTANRVAFVVVESSGNRVNLDNIILR